MPTFRAHPPLALCALALGTGAFAGCSGEVRVGKPGELSGEAIAKDLRQEYADRERDSGITLTSLTCEEVDNEVDAQISCSGRNSKEIDLELSGEITSVEGDGFDYTWRVSKAFGPAALFERPLRPQVERVLRRPVRDVSCPVRVQLVTGGRFRCTIELTAQARFVADIRQTNGSGSFTWGIRRGSGTVGG